MKPHIDATFFGAIQIDGEEYDFDVLIRLDGRIEKRKKKLSKTVYGSSHTVALPEAEQVYEEGAEELVVGTGQSGLVRLSTEAQRYFDEKHCLCILEPTPRAVRIWNESGERTIGLFHVTC